MLVHTDEYLGLDASHQTTGLHGPQSIANQADRSLHLNGNLLGISWLFKKGEDLFAYRVRSYQGVHRWKHGAGSRLGITTVANPHYQVELQHRPHVAGDGGGAPSRMGRNLEGLPRLGQEGEDVVTNRLWPSQCLDWHRDGRLGTGQGEQPVSNPLDAPALYQAGQAMRRCHPGQPAPTGDVCSVGGDVVHGGQHPPDHGLSGRRLGWRRSGEDVSDHAASLSTNASMWSRSSAAVIGGGVNGKTAFVPVRPAPTAARLWRRASGPDAPAARSTWVTPVTI